MCLISFLSVQVQSLVKNWRLDWILAFLKLEEKKDAAKFYPLSRQIFLHRGFFFQVKLSDADEKIVSLSQELDALKSELKSSSEKISLEQKRLGSANENLKDELNTALEKIEIVSSNFLSLFVFLRNPNLKRGQVLFMF